MKIPNTGQSPYGFRWEGHRLVKCGEEAEVRLLIFNLFAEHRRKAAVARILNDLGLRTRRGSKWSDVAVTRQLTCTSAKGVYAINKTKKDESGKRVERPDSEWDYIQCDPIISDELWNQVQAILNEQRTTSRPSGRKPVHTFSGILRCACGGKMAVPSNSPKYVCGDCRNKIPCEDLEDIFRDQLSFLIRDRPDLFGEPAANGGEQAETESRLAEARETFAGTRREMTHFENLLAGGDISLERFSEVHPPLEEKRKSLSDEIRRLEQTLSRKKSNSPSTDEAESNKSFRDSQILIDHWHSIPVDDRRAIVQTIVSQITIGDGEIEFAYQFPDKSEDLLKDAAVSRQTANPTNGPPESATDPDEPIYIRLPKPGEHCARTGLSRSMLNELILPTKRNKHRPPVKSINLRKGENIKGTRLILWESLKSYLREKEK